MTELVAYHLPGAWGLPSVSPFCLKLDAWLRMADIPHRSVTATTPFGGPKGKAPWIEHGDKKIGDSSLIIEYLKAEYQVDPDAHLSPEQKGVAVAIQRLIDENLYWAMVHDRWLKPENWSALKGTVLGGIPAPVRMIMAPFARRGVRAQIVGHGMGIHSAEEIATIAGRDIDALSAILGDKDYFFGDRPSATDAVVYGQLANIHSVGFASPMKPMIAAHANLVAFIDRFKALYYPD